MSAEMARLVGALDAIEDALGEIRLDWLPPAVQEKINYAWACAREHRGNPSVIPAAVPAVGSAEHNPAGRGHGDKA